MLQRNHHKLLAAVTGALVTSVAVAVAVPAAATSTPRHTATAACKASDIALSWGAGGSAKPGGSGDQQETAVVQLKNTGHHACTIKGIPDVVLTRGSQSETMFEQEETAHNVTLSPGGTAKFTITFLSDTGKYGNKIIRPDKAVITLPAMSSPAKTLPWKWGAVSQQEAASHPGNYVSPIS